MLYYRRLKIALLIMLKMRPRFFGITSGVIFLFMAIAHSLRALYEWEVVVNG